MLCKISDLQPGDQFIWADRRTRRVMLVDLENGYRAKIITFLGLLPGDMFRFRDDYGGEKTYCYSDSLNLVHKVVGGSSSVLDVSCEMNCDFCNMRYGDHFGLRCPRIPGGIFAPGIETANQPSDWLMEELGL